MTLYQVVEDQEFLNGELESRVLTTLTFEIKAAFSQYQVTVCVKLVLVQFIRLGRVLYWV